MKAPRRALSGIVTIHAQRMFLATPHLTADSLLVAPTPIIELVMTCVVLTGIPANVTERRTSASRSSLK